MSGYVGDRSKKENVVDYALAAGVRARQEVLITRLFAIWSSMLQWGDRP